MSTLKVDHEPIDPLLERIALAIAPVMVKDHPGDEIARVARHLTEELRALAVVTVPDPGEGWAKLRNPLVTTSGAWSCACGRRVRAAYIDADGPHDPPRLVEASAPVRQEYVDGVLHSEWVQGAHLHTCEAGRVTFGMVR